MPPEERTVTMEVTDFDSAVAAALAEEGAAPDESAIESPDLLADQAEVEVSDQAVRTEAPAAVAAEEAPAEEGIFDGIEIEAPTRPPVDPESQTFTLPGSERPVTLQELKDGYLRQADYTRKTQQVAQERKGNEEAFRFWTALQADPIGVARTLAEHAGLLAQGAAPQVNVELSPLRTKEQVEAEIDRRVNEALGQHPAVVEARATKAQVWLAGERNRLNQIAGRELSDNDWRTVLRFATEKGITDLELSFNALMAEKGRRQAATAGLRDVAPARNTSRAVTQEVTTPAGSFEEAVQRATAQVATSSR